MLIGTMMLLAAVAASTPAPQSNDPTSSWQKRYARNLAAVRAGGSKVVFLGDSILGFLPEPWGAKPVWDRYWTGEPYKALNFGYPGDRTENVLWRVTEGGELDGYEAKAVVLMIGGENLVQRGDCAGDVICGIRKLLDAIRAKQPKARIVLCAILPRGRTPDLPIRTKIAVVNREIRKFADGRSVVWCDPTDRFLGADGVTAAHLMPDGVFPNELGCIAFTSAVMPLVNDILRGGGLPVGPVCSVAPDVRDSDAGKPAAVRPVTRIMEKSWRGENWWGDRFARNRDFIAASGGKVDLVIAGDSISHFWEDYGGRVYASLTNRVRVLNCGYGGDQTQNVLWRFRHGELDGYKAKTVMLMIGTNNNGINGYNPTNTASGVKACLDLIAAKQPQAKVLLCGYLPRAVGTKDGDVAKDNGANARNRVTTELIRKLADGKKIVFIDLYDKFLEDGRIPKSLMGDYIHPTEKGYAIWLSAIEPYL